MSDKTKGTKDTLFWSTMFIVLLLFSGWQLRQNKQLQEQVVNNEFSSPQQLLDTVAQTRAYELSMTGKSLVWPEDLTILGGQELAVDQTRLVLTVNELSCTTCRDEQTAFALEVAQHLGSEHVTIVVGAQQPRYARSYMRLNQIQMPIFYNQSNSFFHTNGITDSPLLLVLNAHGEVVTAHYPLPEKPKLTVPFHSFCRNLFGLPQPVI